jgi:hypothetical protein
LPPKPEWDPALATALGAALFAEGFYRRRNWRIQFKSDGPILPDSIHKSILQPLLRIPDAPHLNLLADYASGQGFTVVQKYVAVETTEQPGRSGFAEMVNYFKSRITFRTTDGGGGQRRPRSSSYDGYAAKIQTVFVFTTKY